MTKPPQGELWRRWYGLRVWRRRAERQIKDQPLCAECRRQGRVTAARVAGI